MSKAPSLQRFLVRAKEEEQRYSWLTAVAFHKKAFNQALTQRDVLKPGDIQERIGYCFQRAAFQAKTKTDFKERMHLAANAYYDAIKLFEKVEQKERHAKSNHCHAMATYVKFWLEKDVSAKRQQLDQCWNREKEALRVYKNVDDPLNVGKTCNSLLILLTNRLDLEWDAEARETIVHEALKYGEEAIRLFSRIHEKHSLALAYTLTSTFYRNAACVRSQRTERQEECRKKALTYAKRAMELSEAIDDAYLIGLSAGSLAEYYLDVTGGQDSAYALGLERLQCAELTKDNLLLAEMLCGLAVCTWYKIVEHEDPDKAREAYRRIEEYGEDAIRHFNIIGYDAGIANVYLPKTLVWTHLSTMETNLKNKRQLIKNAVKLGYKGLEYARRSGQMRWVYFMNSALSSILICLIRVETDADRKRGLLEEAVRYIEECMRILQQASACATIEPRDLHLQGYFWRYALTQSERASMEKTTDRKITLLTKAVKNMRIAREYYLTWEKTPWSIPSISILLNIGRRLTSMGEMLSQLLELTDDLTVSDDAIKAFEESIAYYHKAESPSSRIAENYWQIAQVYDKTGSYINSSENFALASQHYVQAAEKLPQLQALYHDYASYMRAWHKIQKARHHHAEKEHRQATAHYEQAATLHESTERWNYLSSNYYAWARLEDAEHNSRMDRTEEAKAGFQQAATLFVEAKQAIRTQLKTIENEDEKDSAVNLVKASDTRHQYCLGRIALEEARILDRQGKHFDSSVKYGVATDTFQKVADAMEHESDRRELVPIVDLSRAWQMMTRAEADASPDLYLEASHFFEQAKEHSLDETAKVLALGHSIFCKALEAGTRFEATRDQETYAQAKQHLVAAQNYYVKAAFPKAVEYARATQRLLDAYMYMYQAETEIDPTTKARYYQLSKKLLDASAASYTLSNYPEKAKQVQRLIEDAKEEHRLAQSLSDLFHPPMNASSPETFEMPSQSPETAVGLDRFDDADIQARLAVSDDDVTVGETVEFQLDLVNAGRHPGLLVRVDDLIPPGFKLSTSPPSFPVEHGSVDLKGRRLAPLNVESIKLALQPTESGIRMVRPQVIYVNEAGTFRTSKLAPVTITVQPPRIFEFKTKTAKIAFDFLIKAFVQDYMRRRIVLEKAGWRTLMAIVKQGKVSKYSVYGAGGRRGRAVAELERRGLVEVRVFPGERGRGGNILKLRIAYAKDPVKRYVDGHIMKKTEK